jgi:hypothetical protein
MGYRVARNPFKQKLSLSKVYSILKLYGFNR